MTKDTTKNIIKDDFFESLQKMQDVLAEKNKLEIEILEEPGNLAIQRNLLERLKTEYIAKDKEAKELSEKIAVLKAELSATEKKKEDSEQAMDNIKTQREYESLDKEIADANKKASDLRRDLQYFDGEFRKLEEEIAQTQAQIEQNESEISKKSEILQDVVNNKKLEIERLEKEKRAIAPDMSEDDIFKFERIIKNKKGKGIVAVKDGACEGCHIMLPPQFINEVRDAGEIKYCPYCSRILFYEKTQISVINDDDDDVFDDSEMGGLADLV